MLMGQPSIGTNIGKGERSSRETFVASESEQREVQFMAE
jgi:hypothetical protein